MAGGSNSNPLCYQTGNDSGQHIAHTAGGHSGIAGGIDKYSAIGMRDNRAGAFENYMHLAVDCELSSAFYSILLNGADLGAHKTGHFTGVGG